jgi:hypothetical protein
MGIDQQSYFNIPFADFALDADRLLRAGGGGCSASRQQLGGYRKPVDHRARQHHTADGAVPLVAYYTFAFGCPEVLLTLLYGGASYSLDAGSVLRLLAVASTISYLADMICSYFHGIDESVLALIVNAVGSVATLCAIPLISRHGVVGACIAVMVANIVRALLSRYFLNRTTGDGVAYVAK